MSGQSATMSAKESKAIQKQIESGHPLSMCGADVSTASMSKQAGGAKNKPISRS